MEKIIRMFELHTQGKASVSQVCETAHQQGYAVSSLNAANKKITLASLEEPPIWIDIRLPQL